MIAVPGERAFNVPSSSTATMLWSEELHDMVLSVAFSGATVATKVSDCPSTIERLVLFKDIDFTAMFPVYSGTTFKALTR